LESLKPNSVFLAFGEVAESEDGLEAKDIELIMKQLSVERNVAIKALRKTNSLIDAIFEIGNDM
jgi:NACalpha-BTF3-like transcription factor